MSLNPRQKRFAELYHLCGNATEAYLGAYGGEYDNAKANGSRLLANDNVSQYVEELKAEARSEFKVTRSDMLELFHGIATDKEEETRDRISAGKEVCRIMGFYATEKVELSASSEVEAMLSRVMGAKE